MYQAIVFLPLLGFIIAAIISMAQSLGLKTIAEGVETARQRDLLKGLGCHQFQGYLFSRPVPEEEIVKLLPRKGVGTY